MKENIVGSILQIRTDGRNIQIYCTSRKKGDEYSGIRISRRARGIDKRFRYDISKKSSMVLRIDEEIIFTSEDVKRQISYLGNEKLHNVRKRRNEFIETRTGNTIKIVSRPR